jgi:hypothetical protein
MFQEDGSLEQIRMIQELHFNLLRSNLGREHAGRQKNSALRFRDADYHWMVAQYHRNALSLC